VRDELAEEGHGTEGRQSEIQAMRFGLHLEAIFRHNPLTGFTVSFAGTPLTFTANIGPQSMGDGSVWVVGWQYETQRTHPELMRDPVRLSQVERTRDELGYRIAMWLAYAIRRPAEVAAETLAELEGDWLPEIEDEPEPHATGPDDTFLDVEHW
jgi:hypothetical protein